ncbi:hypothetical protein SAMN02745673_02500 [Marinactinospora thermotolerans DSM 45154]|uniref:Uncharacterized protein n=1 Tax=Marinactinospora thermotolerans DSM 45154 TaxID=1122192 RepID=A0A1T4R3U2_9ACTN|nr:hypothetical protein SAMN02745673_02500 [Marinactinospora thermotolerans DSM 45154]
MACGGSLSDGPLFGHLARTVAVNADHHLADIARVDHRGTDLWDAYLLGRGLLDGSGEGPDTASRTLRANRAHQA